VVVGYPLVPWIAVMALGFCLGELFTIEAQARRRALVLIGTAAILAFVVLRALNLYGDPAPWSVQHSGVYTALSFLNTTKYPPSLAFLLMTVGPTLLALAWLDGRDVPPSHPFLAFGRVPLFYFVLHFYAAHALAVLFAAAQYGSVALAFVFHPVPSMGGPRELFPADFGYKLWVAYAVWALVVVALYPLCRWFARIKASRHGWWWRYL
jgi:uncharacterized membrane protein